MADMTIFPTGLTYSRNTKAPLESNRLFDTLALAQAYVSNLDQTAYVGLTLSVVADGDNNGLYYVEQIADENNSAGKLIKVGSGSGSESVETYAEALALATDENIGQTIYVTTETTEGEGDSAVTYSAGPYIVNGAGSLSKLVTASASGDVTSDVENLKTDVESIESVIGNEDSGLVKDVNDLQATVEALPENFVTDVKVDGVSVVSEGVAEIDLSAYAKSADVASKVDFDALVEEVGEPAVDDAAATGIYKLIADTEAALRSEMSVIPKFTIQVVDELPESNASSSTVYLVKDKDVTGDLYTEYIFVNNAWENLGKQTVDLSSYATIVDMNAAIASALESYVKTSDFDNYKSEVSTALNLKANVADVYSKTDADATFVKSADYVAYSQEDKDKLAGIAAGAQINVIEAVKVKVSDGTVSNLEISEKSVTVDLSEYAKSNEIAVKSVTTGSTPVGLTLTDGVLAITADVYSKNDVNNALTAKLNASATVNEKAFENDAVVLDSADLKLNAVISRVNQGTTEDVYTTEDTVQGVLANLSERIDNINTIVDGQITGVASIQSGNGIAVSGESSSPIVSVKIADTSLSATTDGLSVKIASNSAISLTEDGLDIVWSELS